jgi:undecaprenyl-phosphate 4-deoxy-4-formamido-L-arabinose transferase
VELSVVIPVYYSEATLSELAERLLRVLDATGLVYEVIFVDDGSKDGSWPVVTELQARHPDRIVAIELMRNFGQHNALMCGFRHARGEYIVTMDDDLQNPPEEIPKLVAAIRGGNLDVVYGAIEKKAHSAFRNTGSWVVNAFYGMVFDTPVSVTSFRIVRREVIEKITSYHPNFIYIDGLLAWNTDRIGEVAVEHHARAGPSGYSLGKLVLLAINLSTNFSLLPLQVASALGLVIAACGMAAGAYYLALTLLAQITVPGYASTIVAVLFLGGVQLIALGIIGEYVGRLHMNVGRKPQYSVRSVLGTDAETRAHAETDRASVEDGTRS